MSFPRLTKHSSDTRTRVKLEGYILVDVVGEKDRGLSGSHSSRARLVGVYSSRCGGARARGWAMLHWYILEIGGYLMVIVQGLGRQTLRSVVQTAVEEGRTVGEHAGMGGSCIQLDGVGRVGQAIA